MKNFEEVIDVVNIVYLESCIVISFWPIKNKPFKTYIRFDKAYSKN